MKQPSRLFYVTLSPRRPLGTPVHLCAGEGRARKGVLGEDRNVCEKEDIDVGRGGWNSGLRRKRETERYRKGERERKKDKV